MSRVRARLSKGDYPALVADHYRRSVQQMERAALEATHIAAVRAKNSLRTDMAAGKLGRLGQAIGSTSDREKGQGVHRLPGGGFSASGVVYVRSKSERTLGAIEAYTQGADIRPVKGRWLWYPTDEIQRIGGKGSDKRRLTPGNWTQFGMDQKIGPLVRIRAANGNPLLIVRNVGVSAAGARRSAKSLTKRGQPRKGQVRAEFIVAFIGIPRTSRAARVNVRQIMEAQVATLPALFEQELRKVARK